jgi:hypothetical protein
MLLFTSLSKLSTSTLDLPFCQLRLCVSMQGHLPSAIDTTGVTIPHMFLQMILPLKHLVLFTPRADIAGVNTVRVLYAMPQISVTARVRLAASDFLTPPSLVLRTLGVPVETLEVLKLEPTLQTYQTLDLVIISAVVIRQHRWARSRLVFRFQSRNERNMSLVYKPSWFSVRIDRGWIRKFGRRDART